MGTIADKLLYLNGTKSAIFNAISATGISIPSDSTFRQYADYISQLTYVPPVTTGSLSVGSTVYLNENSSPVPYLVVHQGLPSSLYDSSCNGTWLLREKIYSNSTWGGPFNYVASASIISKMAQSLSLFDENIQSVICTVKIPYCTGGGSSTVKSGVDGLSCQLFPLGVYELGFTTSTLSSIPIDGAKLSYFLAGVGSGAATKRIALFGSSAAPWWTRTPYIYSSSDAYQISATGSPGAPSISSSYGIRWAMIMPQDLIVDDSGLITSEVA